MILSVVARVHKCVEFQRVASVSDASALPVDAFYAGMESALGSARSMEAPASFPAPVSALREDGSLDPAHAQGLSDELAVALYEQMVLARHFDERLIALQQAGHIGSHASAIGEEAAIVGSAAAMRDEDWLFLASREIAAALWRGTPLAACAHNAFGTARSNGKGRCGHAPVFWKPARVASVSPLSGTQILHAVGVAWAARLRKDDVAALVFFGEGATSSGDFHAGLNFAGVTRAPIVALCRNNGWAMSTPASRQTASAGFAVKALAYGLRGVRVDGGDVVAVFSVVREARARAAAGEGGTLIEALTTLRHGSEASGGSPSRAEGETSPSDDDPIARMRRHLVARGLSNPEQDQRLFAEVRADVDRAVAEAQDAAAPAPESLFEDVCALVPWHLSEQRDEARRARAGAHS
jgi:pyruvate dehydrogenase E1 component alpha subunit